MKRLPIADAKKEKEKQYVETYKIKVHKKYA